MGELLSANGSIFQQCGHRSPFKLSSSDQPGDFVSCGHFQRMTEKKLAWPVASSELITKQSASQGPGSLIFIHNFAE